MSTVEVTRENRKSVIVSSPSRNSVIEVSDPGVAGPPNILSVGTVTTDLNAAVTITGVAPTQTINFVLPVAGQYVHTQSVSASTWTVTHNLGFFPAVSVIDSGGSVVEGDVSYISVNQVSIAFSSSFGGKAYFS
jgi:hypothetical protein